MRKDSQFTPSQPDFATLAELCERHSKRAELRTVRSDVPSTIELLILVATALRLAAQAQEDRKDAERYRKLRGLFYLELERLLRAHLNVAGGSVGTLTDAAIAAEKGEQA